MVMERRSDIDGQNEVVADHRGLGKAFDLGRIMD